AEGCSIGRCVEVSIKFKCQLDWCRVFPSPSLPQHSTVYQLLMILNSSPLAPFSAPNACTLCFRCRCCCCRCSFLHHITGERCVKFRSKHSHCSGGEARENLTYFFVGFF